MHVPRASSCPATTTKTTRTKPTTPTMRASSLAFLLRQRGRRPSPCVASVLPNNGRAGQGGPALGNRQASPAPVAAAASSSPVPRQQQQQQQQQQSQPRAPPPTPQSWRQWQQQQQQQARQAPRMPRMPPPPPQAPPPSFAPPPTPTPPQGAWSHSTMTAAQQQQQHRQQQQQQQQQTFRPPGASPPPPPPPPSLVLPRTAVVVTPSTLPQQQWQQQQRVAPPTLPQQQEPSWSPPPSIPSPPPHPLPSTSFASPAPAAPAAPSPSFPAPPAPSPPPPPALLIPRAGLMTVEERRAAFARAALRADASARAKELLFGSGKLSEGEQRTKEWHALRDARLTASAFGNALGFWPGGRASLWEEKVGLGKAFKGNAATQWGTEAEPRALEAFVAVSRLEDLSRQSSRRGRTQRRVSECRFEVLCEDDAHDWLGASPDGLIELVVSSSSRGGGDGEEEGLLSSSPSSSLSAAALRVDDAGDADDGDADDDDGGETFNTGGGVLEIKCPFNRGSPLDASPWSVPPHYYVPQVQGLMAITGREWCDLWCWTPGRGATAFRFERDRGYWAQAFEVLADFWWAHVVPGNQAVAAAMAAAGNAASARSSSKGRELGSEEDEEEEERVEQRLDEAQIREAVAGFRPAEEHPLTRSIVRRSKEMAERAARDGSRRRFSAQELEEAIRRTKG